MSRPGYKAKWVSTYFFYIGGHGSQYLAFTDVEMGNEVTVRSSVALCSGASGCAFKESGKENYSDLPKLY